MKSLFSFIVFSILFNNSYCQSDKDSSGYLSKAGLSRLLNQKFGSIVTGQASNTAIGNFASFDPVAGSATFKGSFGFGSGSKKKVLDDYGNAGFIKDSSHPYFITFSLQGDLVNQSYIALFSNSKLNTNAAADIQLHIRLSNFSGIHYKYSDYYQLKSLKENAFRIYNDKVMTLIAEAKKTRPYEVEKRTYQTFENRLGLDTSRRMLGLLLAKSKIAANHNNYTELKKLNALNDTTLQQYEQQLLDSARLKRELDSISTVNDNDIFFVAGAKLKAMYVYDSTLAQIEFSAPYRTIDMSWITITGGGSKTNFYTYDSSLAFSKQIKAMEMSTIRLGLAMNYYHENGKTNHAWFLNFGFLRYKDNNLSILPSRSLTQVDASVNTPNGDTTRSISTTYTVYPDSIIESKVWSLFANWYFIQKGTKQILHVYPSYDLYDHGSNLTNLGLGYIFSFKNATTGQPIINAEGYVQFKDIFNRQKAVSRSYNRNEIGIRLTVPFNFF